MGQLLLVLIVVGVAVWLMRRGGCRGMGKREDKDGSQKKPGGCH